MKPKFLIGIGLIIAAIAAIMVFTIIGNSSMEVKVNELLAQQAANPNISERSLKLTGFVVGDSIVYDANTSHLEFDVVNSRDDLISNLTTAKRMRVVADKVAKPDTLVHEASAIVTGKLNPDGRFHAGNSPDALLLQCPTKYASAKDGNK